MRQVAPDLWCIDHPLRLLGVEFGTRTTVVRLRDGGLWLHSPGPLDAAHKRALEAIGPVRCVVAPNKMHHLFLGDAHASWPAARVFLAPGLADKRRDLPAGEMLSAAPPAAWSGRLEQVHVRGAPQIEEVAFFHPASRSLLLADLCFCFGAPRSAWEWLFQRANGIRGFGPSRLMRLGVRDRAALRASIERISSWDFERIVLAHGSIVERDASHLWRQAWTWLEDT